MTDPDPDATASPSASAAGPGGSGQGRPDVARPTVVLDPGHNGGNAAHPEKVNRQVPAGGGQHKECNTVGAQTARGYAEHAFNFDVAQRVQRLLTDRGVEVRMTRANDSGVGPCINERAEFGNTQRADAVVAIHADGADSGHGFHVIEAEKPPAGPTVAAASHRLAVAVHDRYLAGSTITPSTYIGENGYDRRADLAGLSLSSRPTIFLECGNMRDPSDAAKMESTQGRQRLAQAITDGILAYLGR